MPRVTQALIIANVVVFLADMATRRALSFELALWPIGERFAPWQLVTYAFLHGNLTHLVFNMFGIYMFGSDLERVWGPQRHLVFYATSVIVAALVQLVFTAVTGGFYPTLGASGGLFGLLLAFALYFPHRRVMLIIPPIPMPAWVFATLYGVVELVLGVTGTASGVAHFAHLGGMLGGYLLIRHWRSGTRRRRIAKSMNSPPPTPSAVPASTRTTKCQAAVPPAPAMIHSKHRIAMNTPIASISTPSQCRMPFTRGCT